jgi:hypothetical protein
MFVHIGRLREIGAVTNLEGSAEVYQGGKRPEDQDRFLQCDASRWWRGPYAACSAQVS